ncbi:glycosyltransferase N-terminal domain-containing protein [Pelagicoccus sp. SDUM812003]|uniref:3-deoxy-D-manno-octulosonic acid transferase n=1 Tax=Pelagicoccus sp. SDUM812003 TaxID=3041267 RepID=UPI00280FDA26|nr:glycosyltransferase N-terminal domain-containing protein [Pelagicoccus sp. SDUM812003]MDQ8202824.1 glycosyltransferase N-terminal domain-containing protein [Pelagicoccus sp. SDUM812003]
MALLSLPGYLLHIRKRGGYRDRFGTRFGKGLKVPPKAPGRKRIWIQAVSLGEMLAIEPLLKRLESEPEIEIYLTVTTSTGYALAKEKYGRQAVGISYFPMDFWLFSHRVWNRIDPDLAICAETELWPEHLQQAKRRGVPFLLINARLSDRSFRRSLQLRWLYGGFMNRISRVFACSDQDRKRFIKLGMDPERVETTGNIKVDVTIEPILDEREKSDLKERLGLGSGFLLLGSSTWPGEEAMLLKAFRALRETQPSARLLIVPRHGERRDEIEALLRRDASDLRTHFKSRGLPQGEVDALIADTHGELRQLTQLADLVFVGKSLPPHTEGQTPVECGILGVPLLFGPGMSNFRSIRAGLLQFGAARQVNDELEALETIVSLSQDAESRRRMGQGGKRWKEQSQGAVDRTVDGIKAWLASK